MGAVNQPNLGHLTGPLVPKKGGRRRVQVCPVCWSRTPVKDGRVRAHREHGERCEGSGMEPVYKHITEAYR